MGDISIDDAVKNFKLINNENVLVKEINCECEYPCHTNLCPKDKNQMIIQWACVM